MSTEKVIKIKVSRAEDIGNVLKSLGGAVVEKEIIVRVPENKDTMRFLCTSDLIEDWDYVNEETKTSPSPIPSSAVTTPTEEEKVITTPEDLIGLVVNTMKVTDSLEVSRLIYVCWQVSKVSPAFIFSDRLLKGKILDNLVEVRKQKPSIDQVMVKTLIETYYPQLTFPEIVIDILKKIKTSWKTLGNLETMAKVAEHFFKGA